MNFSKQAERAGPLFKKSVTIEDIKMLIKILNQKLDVAIKAEFSFSNGDYTNVNTEEMLETRSDSYERVRKSKMSADAAEFVPMSHKIEFSCNGEISRSASLMKQLANSYSDRDSPDNVSYAFTNENNSAGVKKLLSEDSREQNENIKDEQKQEDENPNSSEENHSVSTELEAKIYEDSCNINQQLKAEESKRKIKNEDVFESPDFADVETSNNDVNEKSSSPQICTTKSEDENISFCNDFLGKAQILSEEEEEEIEQEIQFDDTISADSEPDNKNFSALNKNSEDDSIIECQYSLDDCAAKPESEDKFKTSPIIEEDPKTVELEEHSYDDLIAEKVDLMLGELSRDIAEKLDEQDTDRAEKLDEQDTDGAEKLDEQDTDSAEKLDEQDTDKTDDYVENQTDNKPVYPITDDYPVKDENSEDFGEASIDDLNQKEEAVEESMESDQKPLKNMKEDPEMDKLQAQILEVIRCELKTKEIGTCHSYEETMIDECSREISDDDHNISNDSIELEIVPETIKSQWNSNLTNRMLAYSLHLRCTELSNIYKAWSEANPPILPTKFWGMKKQNSYTMQSIAENISLVCLKCEVVQMKLEAEQQKLKYEEIDKKMQLSFQKESKSSDLQKKLEEAWKKATKTEEMLSHKIWAKRKNWFNIFALFYQKPDVILPRSRTFERARRPFFSANRDRSRLFFRRAWRR